MLNFLDIVTNIPDIPALVTIFSAGVPPVASTVVNASSEAPVVTMRILNEEHMDAIVTQLGQKLTLRIEIHPINGGSRIHLTLKFHTLQIFLYINSLNNFKINIIYVLIKIILNVTNFYKLFKMY